MCFFNGSFYKDVKYYWYCSCRITIFRVLKKNHVILIKKSKTLSVCNVVGIRLPMFWKDWTSISFILYSFYRIFLVYRQLDFMTSSFPKYVEIVEYTLKPKNHFYCQTYIDRIRFFFDSCLLLRNLGRNEFCNENTLTFLKFN